MPLYRPVSFFALLVMISLSIFFFIEDEDTVGKQLVFFAIYVYIGLFFVLKSVYYFRQGATFNEIFFVVGLPIMPPMFAGLGYFTGVNNLYFSDLFQLTFTLRGQIQEFSLSFASMLALPYFFFSMYLLLRTFIRYQFLRWSAHSTNGPSGTFIGLVLALSMGAIYIILAMILSDVLLGIFGFFYLLNGILGFLA